MCLFILTQKISTVTNSTETVSVFVIITLSLHPAHLSSLIFLVS